MTTTVDQASTTPTTRPTTSEMFEQLWHDATEETRASIDGEERDERRVRMPEHAVRQEALTAA